MSWSSLHTRKVQRAARVGNREGVAGERKRRGSVKGAQIIDLLLVSAPQLGFDNVLDRQTIASDRKLTAIRIAAGRAAYDSIRELGGNIASSNDMFDSSTLLDGRQSPMRSCQG